MSVLHINLARLGSKSHTDSLSEGLAHCRIQSKGANLFKERILLADPFVVFRSGVGIEKCGCRAFSQIVTRHAEGGNMQDTLRFTRLIRDIFANSFVGHWPSKYRKALDRRWSGCTASTRATLYTRSIPSLPLPVLPFRISIGGIRHLDLRDTGHLGCRGEASGLELEAGQGNFVMDAQTVVLQVCIIERTKCTGGEELDTQRIRTVKELLEEVNLLSCRL